MLRRPALRGPAEGLCPTERQPIKRRSGTALAACLSALAVLTGCGSTASTLSAAARDSSSAIATARLALSLDTAGKLTNAATATALDDALKELQTSRNTVLQLAPASKEDREAIKEALTVLDDCAAAMTTARDAVASSTGTPAVSDGVDGLAAAADRVSKLKEKDGGQ
ncbi:conserved exported hypothetical protein [Arthrobacter sp. 9AX]|uniref:hypothetical protein n=1 Tax=Arthrobacter sp. 9AX TaxID=2653131 RepID=UPI0012EF7B0E|nr:hypothetical protein [Arthrobacter sp. 9AX]VXC56466.1 conserved exported hypothetical protein [Arthrobacter sp. 9AX]